MQDSLKSRLSPKQRVLLERAVTGEDRWVPEFHDPGPPLWIRPAQRWFVPPGMVIPSGGVEYAAAYALRGRGLLQGCSVAPCVELPYGQGGYMITKQGRAALGVSDANDENNSWQFTPTASTCEICTEPVLDAGEHYRTTKVRPDGFWICHPRLGRCQCAKCNHVWRPRGVAISARCPTCGETDDLFWADDGGWERAAKERIKVKHEEY